MNAGDAARRTAVAPKRKGKKMTMIGLRLEDALASLKIACLATLIAGLDWALAWSAGAADVRPAGYD